MDKLVSQIGEVTQDIEIARTFAHGLKDDIVKYNYSNAINNYKKLIAINNDLSKKLTKLKATMAELEKVVNGIQE
jgi:hypothetical protein